MAENKTPDLAALKAQRDALDKQIMETEKTERIETLKTCVSLIKKHGFSPKELGIRAGLVRKSAAKPQYISPTGVTWAGRGRKPMWLQEQEKLGRSAEEFRITTAGAKAGSKQK